MRPFILDWTRHIAADPLTSPALLSPRERRENNKTLFALPFSPLPVRWEGRGRERGRG